MRTDHVNSSATSPHHLYFFPIFFIWNYKIYHIWQFLVFILVTGFQCHSVPVKSGDCSGEITGISKFRGRSEILIHRNDRNLAGICGASLRPPMYAHKCSSVSLQLATVVPPCPPLAGIISSMPSTSWSLIKYHHRLLASLQTSGGAW